MHSVIQKKHNRKMYIKWHPLGLVCLKFLIRRLLKLVLHFSDWPDSKRDWAFFSFSVGLFSQWVTVLVMQRDKCVIFSIWKRPKKHSSAQPQPFGWEFSTYVSSWIFFSDCWKLLRWGWGKVQAFDSTQKIPANVVHWELFFTAFFCWKMPTPCHGGSAPTNCSV